MGKTKYNEKIKESRIGEERYNNNNELMKCIEYNTRKDVVIQFQDYYHAKVHTDYDCFLNGRVKNPYSPIIFNVGITGNKYSISNDNNKTLKEYTTWWDMLKRCYSLEYKEKHLAYHDTTCCKEWLLYENFYEWLHSQENFNKWINNKRSAIDKDILIKGNKIYSPDTCCLVPCYVNSLFVKQHKNNSNLPIGIRMKNDKYSVQCSNLLTNKKVHLGTYDTLEEGFLVYKKFKEDLIKNIAKREYNDGNITKKCYEAMMNYEVEITD